MPNRVALVTGGGKGIGRAIVLRLAGDGFDLSINDQLEETGKAVAEEVRKMGGKATAFPTDVSKSAEVKAMFFKVMQEFGRVDVLVTCAGISQLNTLDELNEEIWDRTMDINAKGAYLCILEAMKPMMRQRWGRIITIGSVFGIQGAKDFAVYSASKFAVRGMTQAFAKELGPYGITVNCVVPGYIWTDMWRNQEARFEKMYGSTPREAFEQIMEKQVPLKKPGEPEDVAPIVSFLASEEAYYITAATIPIGGGTPIF